METTPASVPADSAAGLNGPIGAAHRPDGVSEPDYLQRVYWWAYLHPNAIRIFERQWIINLILWGNYARLRDVALAELAGSAHGHILQLACVYGNFTERLAQGLSGQGRLAVVDVARIQLDNLRQKLGPDRPVTLHHQNAADLTFADGSFDATAIFFLLHELPLDVRVRTLSEAVRVTKKGGRIVVVDYHKPRRGHPLRYVMPAVFKTLEPFAMDLWNLQIEDWLPPARSYDVTKQTFFGGLYQMTTIVPQ